MIRPKNRSTARTAPPGRTGGRVDASPSALHAPRPRKWLLALAIAVFAAWIAFLLVLAVRARSLHHPGPPAEADAGLAP